MDAKTANEIIADFFKGCTDVLTVKADDYGGKKDRLDNFKTAAATLGLSPFQVWAVYFHKHVDSILKAINKNPDCPTTSSEPIEGRCHDVANYIALFVALKRDLNGDDSVPIETAQIFDVTAFLWGDQVLEVGKFYRHLDGGELWEYLGFFPNRLGYEFFRKDDGLVSSRHFTGEADAKAAFVPERIATSVAA